jgi:hypothetical protein
MNWFRRMAIARDAARVLRKLGVTHPPVRAQDVATALGLTVRFAEFETATDGVGNQEDFRTLIGFSDPARRTIYVNAAATPGEKQMVIAAETAKYRLRPKEHAERSTVFERHPDRTAMSRLEMEAEWFAICLLAPRAWIERLVPFATAGELETVFIMERANLMRSVSRDYRLAFAPDIVGA